MTSHKRRKMAEEKSMRHGRRRTVYFWTQKQLDECKKSAMDMAEYFEQHREEEPNA
jgi:hypothetical protein